MSRLLVAAVCLGCLVLTTTAAHAAEPAPPGQAPPAYERFGYPSQIPTGPIEDGTSPVRAGSGFLTLPFMGPHYVTAIFDHCGPDYIRHGRVCRYDGRVRSAEGLGETRTTGKDYLYYDGHDGIDYALVYEPVAAAADGVVTVADWDRPGCERCGFGLNVFVDHGNGFLTRYAHLYALGVGVGQRVRRGQVLGVSGTTGVSTGEHLHFGVYRDRPRLPVDPYGWSGSGPDPWPNDAGNLWQGGAPRFPPVSLPSVVVMAAAVEAEPGAVDVAWTNQGGGTFDVEVSEDGGRMSPWLSSVPAGSSRFKGRPGHGYAFVAVVRTDLGWTAAGASAGLTTGRTRLEP
jgi:murein DD-endopeptidase MepM/ murein hydrolase activator NlpD